MHVTSKELQALAGLGRLTVNPETGLPEAGWFSDIVSFAAPIVGGFLGGPAGAAIGGAIGGGVKGGLPGAVLGGGLGYIGGGGFAEAGAGAGGLDAINSFDSGAMGDILGTGVSGGVDNGFLSQFGDFVGNGAELLSNAAGLGDGGYAAAQGINEAATSTLGSGWGQQSSLMDIIKRAKGLPWKTIADVGNIGSGLYGMYQGQQLKQQSSLGDDELRALMADPSRIYGMPGWQAGLQAIQRAGAAQGWTGSGNMMAALQKYGGDFYNQEFQRLAGLRGGNVAGQTAGLGLQGQSINRVLAGIAGMGGNPQKAALDQILEKILGRA